ncbi:MAG: hypothetical protein MZV49_22080 [Rhodopseudomonas palustris]|nr:hypothetical protein [Rhodopseudomonas palustris]
MTVRYENGQPVGVTHDRRLARSTPTRTSPQRRSRESCVEPYVAEALPRRAGSPTRPIWHVNPTGTLRHRRPGRRHAA